MKNQINRICLHYNLGGDGTKERPTYPVEYGARCEFYNKFFSKNEEGKLEPNCYQCVKDIETLLRVIC